MSDINFLPPEFKIKERELRKKSGKRPEDFEVELTKVSKDRIPLEKSEEKPFSAPSRGLFSSIFKPKLQRKEPPKIKEPSFPKLEKQARPSELAPSKPFVARVYKYKIEADQEKSSLKKDLEIQQESQKRLEEPKFWQKIFPSKPKEDRKDALRKEEVNQQKEEKGAVSLGPEVKPFKDQERARPLAPIPSKIEKKPEPKKKQPPSLDEGRDVNLVPLEISLASEAKRRAKVLVLFNIGCLLVLGIIYFVFEFLLFWRVGGELELKSLDVTIKRVERQTAKFKKFEDQVCELREKINTTRGLLDEHIYWTNFFSLLEKYTLPQVVYLSFGGDTGGRITMNALASDYETLAKQLVVFQKAKEFVRSVEISAASRAEGASSEISGVEFTINLNIQPEVFKR